MRTLIVVLATLASLPALAVDPPARVVVHLIDPRVVTFTDQTISTQWHDAKTDVIATRTLTVSEGRRLRKLLTDELAEDGNVPFCGHSPAYAVAVTPHGKATTTVTLCGTCGTWAKNGDLRALHGKSSLQYLEALIPLPDVFRSVGGTPPRILDPFDDRKKLPFYLLDNSGGG